jgi:uncharacterized protein YggE
MKVFIIANLILLILSEAPFTGSTPREAPVTDVTPSPEIDPRVRNAMRNGLDSNATTSNSSNLTNTNANRNNIPSFSTNNTIRAKGRAQRVVVADEAKLCVAIKTSNDTMEGALSHNNDVVGQLINELNQYNITGENISTWNYTAVHDNANPNNHTIIHTIEVDVQDLKHIDHVLQAINKTHGAEITEFEYDLSIAFKAGILSDLQREAFENALEQARKVIQEVGMNISGVQNIYRSSGLTVLEVDDTNGSYGNVGGNGNNVNNTAINSNANVNHMNMNHRPANKSLVYEVEMTFYISKVPEINNNVTVENLTTNSGLFNSTLNLNQTENGVQNLTTNNISNVDSTNSLPSH